MNNVKNKTVGCQLGQVSKRGWGNCFPKIPTCTDCGWQGNTVGLTLSPTWSPIPGRPSESHRWQKDGRSSLSWRFLPSRRFDTTPDNETPVKEMVYLGQAALTLVRVRMVLDRRHSEVASNEYNNRCIETEELFRAAAQPLLSVSAECGATLPFITYYTSYRSSLLVHLLLSNLTACPLLYTTYYNLFRLFTFLQLRV